MPEIQILPAICEDDCEGERGKRGKRGKRGHRGHDGPPGPPATASGGLLKFSGVASADAGFCFLADRGVGFLGGDIITKAPDYPVAVAHSVRNLAVNITTPLPQGISVLVELLRNGVLVPGFSLLYVFGSPAKQLATAGPVPFAFPDTMDIRVTPTGIDVLLDVSATVGVE